MEKEDGMHVYNTQGGSIPIFVHEHMKKDENVTVHHLMSMKKTVPKDTIKHITAGIPGTPMTPGTPGTPTTSTPTPTPTPTPTSRIKESQCEETPREETCC